MSALFFFPGVRSHVRARRHILYMTERTREGRVKRKMNQVIPGLLLPFIGTAAGAACVFFLRGALGRGVSRALTGFAAGVMVAASIWSLIVPAIDQSSDMGSLAFLPAFIGF